MDLIHPEISSHPSHRYILGKEEWDTTTDKTETETAIYAQKLQFTHLPNQRGSSSRSPGISYIQSKHSSTQMVSDSPLIWGQGISQSRGRKAQLTRASMAIP